MKCHTPIIGKMQVLIHAAHYWQQHVVAIRTYSLLHHRMYIVKNIFFLTGIEILKNVLIYNCCGVPQNFNFYQRGFDMNTLLQTTKIPEKLVVTLTADIKNKVPLEIRRNLVQEYRKLFAGLSYMKCKQNYSWGRVWQSALSLTDTMVMLAKQKNAPTNPAVKYLENIHQSHKKHWAQTIMTHPERDNKASVSPEMLDKIYAHGQRWVTQATNALMQILQQYNEHVQELVTEKLVQAAPQKSVVAPAPKYAPAPKAVDARQTTPKRAPSSVAMTAAAPTVQVVPQPKRIVNQPAPQVATPPVRHVAQPKRIMRKKRAPKKEYVAPKLESVPQRLNAASILVQQRSARHDAQMRMIVQRRINIFALQNYSQRAA